jgi:hypothetical protein
MNTTETDSELLIDGNMGIYIPQIFATRYLSAADCERCGIDLIDATILGNVDDPLYREAWETVLDRFTTQDGWTLWQDGDLWLLAPGFEFDNDAYPS